MRLRILVFTSFCLIGFTLYLISCDQSSLETPEPITGANDIKVLNIPNSHPFAFEPYLAVNNGKVVVGFIGTTASPSSFIFKRRVFFSNLNTTISPAADQYGNVPSTGGADPCLDFDAQGNLYTINLINYKLHGDERNAIHFNKFNPDDFSIIRTSLIGEHSKDGALSNSTQEPDKCWLKVNKTNGNIYVSWSGISDNGEANIYFVRSTDGGETFSEPITIVKNGGDNFYVQIEVMQNNNILILWDARGTGKIQSCTSSDNGVSFSATSTIFTNPSSEKNSEVIGPVLTKNSDGSLSLALSILKNNKNLKTTVLHSSDNGISWQILGNQLKDVSLTTAFLVDGKNYLVGYRLSSNKAQYNLWELDGDNWKPNLIKESNTDGFRLNPGDYIGNVIEGKILYSAYTFLSRNGDRNIYVTKVNL
jgi:hypothetical protein